MGNAGIYKITNLINNKIYIGSTHNFIERKSKHKCRKSNTMISRAIFKYGWDNFTFEIVEYCELEKLIEREQFYLDLLQPFRENNGYNILRSCISNGWLGHNHSDETKVLMSVKKEGYIPWNKGKTGVQKCSDETRELMSINRKGEGNSFYNKNHTQEAKDKIAEKARGRDHSYEYKSVIQIDKETDEIIKEWESIASVYLFFGSDPSNSTISRVCRGKQKTAYGFKWKYKHISC